MRASASILLLASSLVHAQQWQQLPDFPGTARDDAAAFTIGGKVYVGTGREVGFGYTNDWFCYDPAIESWSAVSSMPSSGRQYCTTFTIADTGYVFGGTGAAGANNELWAYHPGTDSWEQKASLPAEARYACVATTYHTNAGILTTGMLASGVPTKETWRYAAIQDSWTMGDPIPGPSRHRAACVEYVNSIAVIGGADSNFTALSDAWYCPQITWYQYDSLTYPRWGADGSGNTVSVVACGATQQDVFHQNVWQSFGANNPYPDFPGGTRRGGVGSGIPSASSWSGGTFYYGLGLDGTLARRNDWWCLDAQVGIEQQDPIATFRAYPVPTNDILSVSIHPNAIGAELVMSTLDGRCVDRSRATTSMIMLDTSRLSNGTYILHLITGSGISVQRFIIRH